MKPRISPHDLDLLSAYLDQQLSPRQQAQIETRLKTDPILHGVYAELRRTRAVLRSAPRLRAPRRFTLTPTMVKARPGMRIYPALGFASALASLMFILVVVGDLLGLAGPALSPAAFESRDAPADVALKAMDTAAPAVAEKSADGNVISGTITSTLMITGTDNPGLMPLPAPTEITGTIVVSATVSQVIICTDTPHPAGGGDVGFSTAYPGFGVSETNPIVTEATNGTIYGREVSTATPVPSMTPTFIPPTDTPLAPTLTPALSPTETPPQPVAKAPEATIPPDESQPLAPPEYQTLPVTISSPIVWRLAEISLLVAAIITGTLAVILRIRATR